MSDCDHERCAEICRQAALPVLRQRPEQVKAHRLAETAKAPAESAPAGRSPDLAPVIQPFDGLWLRLPL